MVFEVTATHRVRATGVAACEIYPDVFVIEGRCGVYSRLAGMAAQLPGDFVTALPEGAQEWFSVLGLKYAVSWVSSVASSRDAFWSARHGGDDLLLFGPPVGSMGPSSPPRKRLAV